MNYGVTEKVYDLDLSKNPSNLRNSGTITRYLMVNVASGIKEAMLVGTRIHPKI